MQDLSQQFTFIAIPDSEFWEDEGDHLYHPSGDMIFYISALGRFGYYCVDTHQVTLHETLEKAISS